MKKDDIEKSELSIMSDGEFTAEVFARAKRKKATVRKKIIAAAVSVCSACLVYVFVGVAFAPVKGGSSKGDYTPEKPTYIVGYTDYILYNGEYILLSREKSDELKDIIALASGESDKSSSDNEFNFEQGFVAMIDGVRYVFFDGGISFNTKIIKSKTVGKMTADFIKKRF